MKNFAKKAKNMVFVSAVIGSSYVLTGCDKLSDAFGGIFN